ncbi:MAG: metallophosphoesterase family protein [Euryarchaeota archaeon]
MTMQKTLDEVLSRPRIRAERVLIASDVHVGDRYQGHDPELLETALELARDQDLVVLDGDLADPRAREREVEGLVESLRDLSEEVELVVVPGNHDTLRLVRRLRRSGVSVMMRKYEERRGRGCPPGHEGPSLGGPERLKVGGWRFLIAHGHEPCGELGLEPQRPENPIAQESPMPRRDQLLDNYTCREYEMPDRLEEIARASGADVVVVGHTHCRFLGRFGGVLAVNVGTTACPATCATCRDPLNVGNVCLLRLSGSRIRAKLFNMREGRVVARERIRARRRGD